MSDSNNNKIPTTLQKTLKWQQDSLLVPIKMSLDDVDIPMEAGVLYYDNIVQSFEDTMTQLAALDEVALEKAIADILAKNSTETIEQFLDLEIEELFKVPVEHRGSELKTLVVLSNFGAVESVETQLGKVIRNSFIRQLESVSSVGRDLSDAYDPGAANNNDLPIIPADFNDFPTTPYILMGDSDELLLRTNPNVTIQANIFQKGARFGTDSEDALTIDSTRVGSAKNTLADRVVITTPEGNTLTLYLEAVGGFVKGDIVYEMSNPVSHIDGPGVDVYIDGDTGEQIFVDKFTYTLTDQDFDSATNNIEIHVIDDAPVANNNTNNVDETALFVNGIGSETAIGNVLTDNNGFGVNALGGDGGEISLVNGVTDGGVGDQDGLANGVIVINTTYGQLSMNATTGSYTYTLIDATAVPDGNGTANDIVTYQIIDTDGDTATASLNITINLNQAPTANNDAVGTDEDNPTTYNTPGVLTNDTDPDVGDVLQVVSIDTTGTVGQVNFLANGQISYDPNGLFENLAEGQTTTDTFTYTIEDAEGLTSTATVTVTITGVNDAPVAVVDTDSGAEGNETVASVAVTGNVLTNDTDVDSPQVDFTAIAQLAIGLYGILTLNADGSYSYTINDANATVNAINVGDTLVDVFNYTMSDNNPTNAKTSSSTLSITITGTNDAPVAVADTASGNEGNETVASVAITGNVLTNDTDVDTPLVNLDVTAAVIVGTYGTLTLNADGSYSYAIDDSNATVNALNTGSSVQDVFNYTLNDNHGTDPKTDTGTLTITINGTNDAPVAVADTASGNEGNETVASVAITGNVLTNDTDVDTPLVNLDVTAAVIVGTYGTLTLNADGSYSYAIDDNNATVDALNTGGSVQDVFNYTLNDNHATDPKTDTGTLTITINGTNDAPVIADLDGDVFIHLDGGGAQILNQGAAASITDIDSSDFDTGTLRVEITANAVPAEDVISIQDQGMGAGQIGVAGINITYEGTIIGTVDGGSTNTLLLINFDSDANATSVSALLNAVTYENTNAVNPSTLDRTVDFTVTDGDGGTSTVASVTVTDLDIDAVMNAEIDSGAPIAPGDVLDGVGDIDLSAISEPGPSSVEQSGVDLNSVLGFLGPEILDLFDDFNYTPEL
tara:strand:- start:261863 stop:265243 length:3381 start_codon:yes stop_codon:yes gene_type:complete